jgi:two-component system chemotaxis response regulator CheB
MTMTAGAGATKCHDVIVIGASAGGVEALQRLVAPLPSDLAASILVVLHVHSSGPSALPQILSRAGKLPAVHATSGDRLEAGVIYIAPPGRHLLIDAARLRLSAGARENGHRPAIDPLFRSAAVLGARVMGVILSGTLDDGAAGLLRVKAAGGLAVVQDPEQATYPAMPRNAIAATPVDYVLSVEAIAELIVDRAGTPDDAGAAATGAAQGADVEVAMSLLSPEALHADGANPGNPSAFSCPDCSGVLNEIDEGALRRYRCRTGHAWSPEALVAAQTVAVENALWVALRSLEEKASMASRMARGARTRGSQLSEQRFADQASESLRNAEVLRQLLATWGSHSTVAVEG